MCKAPITRLVLLILLRNSPYHPSPKSFFPFLFFYFLLLSLNSLYFPLSPYLFSIFTIQVPNPPKITKPQMFLSSVLTSQSNTKTTKPNVPKSILSLSPTLLLFIHPSFLTILHPHPHLHTPMSSTTQSFSSVQTHDPNILRFAPTQEKPGSNARQVRGWRASPSDDEEYEWERAAVEDTEQVRQSCENWALFSYFWTAWQEWQVASMPWGLLLLCSLMWFFNNFSFWVFQI